MKSTILLAVLLVHSLPVQSLAQREVRRRPAATHHQAPARADESTSNETRRGVSQQIGQTLPIRRVILYSNGVAYVERRGIVTGHAEVNLSFKQSQVDDVLKSMVVLDLGQGRIGAVSYNSSAPPAARMADIPFSITAESNGTSGGGLAGVLSQLQGARVLVTTTTGATATGSILTVEQRREPPADSAKLPSTTRALVIATESGELSSFNLEQLRSVKLVDEGARRDIKEFASATASARRRDAKTITVTSDGAAAREMVVSYTIAAPIWKTTYRVVMDRAGQPFFQGWAIVDNVSEEDWNDVQLSLISGTPISFIQPIQQPFYRYRPVVPMPSDLRLDPQVYEAADGDELNAVSKDMGGAQSPPTPARKALPTSASGFSQLSSRRGEQRQDLRLQQNSVNNLSLDGSAAAEAPPPAPSLSEAIAGGNSGVAAAAEGEEIGDLFEYQISQPVTVKRDRSALIPILQTRMEGTRVSIYNEGLRRDRPMSGMLLKNTSALTLEDGALTVIDGNAYAGEALLERLKPQEKRLISFALDLGTLVNVRHAANRAPASLVRVAGGIFYAHSHLEDKKTYLLSNQSDKPRIVYIEHPVRQGWEMSPDTPQPEGKSARYYRFRVELAPQERKELTVIERQPQTDTYSLSDVTPDQLNFFVVRGYIDDTVRSELQRIITLKQRVASLGSRVESIDEEVEEIGKDQARLRENITALNGTAEAKQLIARYVAKADQQETRIEALTNEKQTVAAEQAQLQAQLSTAVRALSLDRKLTE